MMFVRHVRRPALALLAIALATPPPLWAQSGRPLAAQTTTAVEALERPARLSVHDVPLEHALTRLHERSGVPVSFSPSYLPRITVSCECDTVTVSRALDQLLRDSGLLYREIDGHVLVHRPIPVDDGMRPRIAQLRYASLTMPKITEAAGGLTKAAPSVPVVGTIIGTVTEAGTNNPVVNAQIAVDGAGRAFTDAQGRYRITNVQPGRRSVSVTSIGYQRLTQEVEVVDGATVTLDFALELSPTTLNELVVTVTGEQRRVELGHVVGRINADSVVKAAPVSSLSELLNGRVSGLQVFIQSGQVGGDVSLQVRTPNSINGALSTAPIVIVDGVRYTSGTTGSNGPFFVEQPSRLNDINPNDIESIEVVKGPSAATLYGTDAANGVIVITTKRGQPGPARWNVYARSTLSEVPQQRYPDNWWGWESVGGIPSTTSSCTLRRVTQGACVQDSVTLLPNPLNDPAQTIFGQKKPRWEYGANVAGGRPDFRYYFSGNFERAVGPLQLPPDAVERLLEQRGLTELPEELREPNALTKMNLQANVTASVGNTAELHLQAGYGHNATRTVSFHDPYLGAVGGATPTSPYYEFSDPAGAFSASSTQRTDRFFGSGTGHWRPKTWLEARGTVGLDLVSSKRYSLLRPGEGPGGVSPGEVGDDRTRQLAVTSDLGLAALARRGRVSFRTAVGAQYVRSLTDALSNTGAGLPPGAESVGQATTQTVGQRYSETVTLGGYLEETVGLNDRLFVTGALRVDGASAFGRDYDAAAYAKASVSWLLSEEPFLPRVPGLEELRLRYAFGTSGQQALSSMALPSYTVAQVTLDGAATNRVDLSGPGNPNLRPERVREHEFGLDAGGLDGRLRLGLTWFRRRSSDLILFRPLPPGFGSSHTNLGLVTGYGFEAELTAQLVETRLLNWHLSVGHSIRRSRVVELGDVAPGMSWRGGYVEGYPLGARFAPSILGYADANGDGILTDAEVQVGQPVYMGESTPPRVQTLTTAVALFQKRLHLSALIERRSGFTQINGLKWRQCGRRSCRGAVDPSTPLEEQLEVVTSGLGIPGGLLMEPGDFTRLREVTASLDLPAALIRAVHVRSATLSVAARNLALWTSFSGPDPESAAIIGYSGEPAKNIPHSRSWAFRLDLGF